MTSVSWRRRMGRSTPGRRSRPHAPFHGRRARASARWWRAALTGADFGGGPSRRWADISSAWRPAQVALLRRTWPNADATAVDALPVEAILGEARRFRAKLIVLGWRGYGPMARLVMGSVSRGVVRHALCPVLVVRRRRDIRTVVVGVDGSPNARKAASIPGESEATPGCPRHFGSHRRTRHRPVGRTAPRHGAVGPWPRGREGQRGAIAPRRAGASGNCPEAEESWMESQHTRPPGCTSARIARGRESVEGGSGLRRRTRHGWRQAPLARERGRRGVGSLSSGCPARPLESTAVWASLL